MKTILIAATLVASSAVFSGSALGCDEKAQRQVVAPLAGATSIKVIGKAGSLDVRGVQGAGEVRASGVACASSKKLLEEMSLKASRKGSEIVIEAVMPESSDVGFWFFGVGQSYRLDFTVQVPAHLPIHVVDGSGSVEIENVASLKLRDGSGEIDISNVAGAVEIDDGSGEMTLLKIGGPIEINDGSGEIDINDVTRDVLITSDGSGSIDIRSVRGTVTIDSDGSGSIDVRDIGGDFIVRSDGSGGVFHASVGGKVRLPRDDR